MQEGRRCGLGRRFEGRVRRLSPVRPGVCPAWIPSRRARLSAQGWLSLRMTGEAGVMAPLGPSRASGRAEGEVV